MLKRVLQEPSKWEAPFVPFSLVDVTKSPNFEIIWLYQGVFRLPYGFTLVSIDILICMILAHICAQCQLLQNAIKRMVYNGYGESFGSGVQVDMNRHEITDLSLLD